MSTSSLYSAFERLWRNILFVLENYATKKEMIESSIPPYSANNNGQFLKIVDGSPTWVTIQNAEEVNF